MESDFPVLLTVTKDMNIPRLPGFRDKIKARQVKVEVWGAGELADFVDSSRCGVRGSPTRVQRVIIPSEENRKGKIFRDTAEEAIDEIAVDLLCHLN